MLDFEFRARDQQGNEEKCIVNAESESAAAKILADKGLSPFEINVRGKKRHLFGGTGVKTKDKILFSRQLSTLINAGLPLVQSLRTVSDQTENSNMEVVIGKIIADVEGGKSFSSSLAKHPRVFNDVFVNLVAAGEASGTLDESLERLAIQQEKDAEISSKVKGALVYPAIVLLVIVGVIIFMLVTVLPQVEQLYNDLNQQLPFLTSVMLAVSDAILNYWFIGILALIAAGWGVYHYAQTDSGRKVVDGLKMNTPIFGRLFMKMYMARFARTGQTLMSAGVPMLETLRITGNSVNNVHIKAAIDKAATKVKGGSALSDSLKGDVNFLKLVPQMLNIGEQSGSMDEMFSKIADFYEKELDNEIKTISTIIEPVLMVALAIVAGGMVGAILIPIYGLVGQNF